MEKDKIAKLCRSMLCAFSAALMGYLIFEILTSDELGLNLPNFSVFSATFINVIFGGFFAWRLTDIKVEPTE